MSQLQSAHNTTADEKDSLHIKQCAVRNPGTFWNVFDRLNSLVAVERTVAHFTILSAVLLVCYVVTGLVSSNSLHDTVNWAGPVTLMIASIIAAFRLLKCESLAVGTPIFWFLLAVAAYCGFGPLVYTFGHVELGQVTGPLALDRESLLRTNLLNIVGILCISGVFVGVNFVWGRLPALPPKARMWVSTNRWNAKSAAFVFLAVGLPVKYFLALPHEFGQLDFTLPGSIYMLADLVPLGILLLGYLSVRGGYFWTAAFVGFLSLELAVEFLRFSKASLLLLFILASIGRYLATRRLTTLVWTGMLSCCLYLALTPIVNVGRIMIEQQTGDYWKMSLNGRTGIGAQAISKAFHGEFHSETATRSAWLRLCYADVQNFVMNRHDDGQPAKTLSNVPYVFVPRLFWPEKPILSDVGVDFTELAFGHRSGSMGIGIFAEAYWNGGWGMVVFLSLFVGFVYAVLGKLSLVWMSEQGWLFLPCILLGMKMGFRIDGWFVIDYAGALVIYAAFLIAISLAYLRWPVQSRSMQQSLG